MKNFFYSIANKKYLLDFRIRFHVPLGLTILAFLPATVLYMLYKIALNYLNEFYPLLISEFRHTVIIDFGFFYGRYATFITIFGCLLVISFLVLLLLKRRTTVL
jgi:hypothetical protein